MAMSAIVTAMDLLFDATDSMDLTSNSLEGTADDLMKFSVSLGGFSGLSEGAADYLTKLSDWLKRHSDITHGHCCELEAAYSDLREVKGELSKLDDCDCAAMTAAAQDAATNATNGSQAGADPGSSKRERGDEDDRSAKKGRSA